MRRERHQTLPRPDDATAISQTFVDSWLDSPGHRENVFDADWRVKGIGVNYAADGAVLAT